MIVRRQHLSQPGNGGTACHTRPTFANTGLGPIGRDDAGDGLLTDVHGQYRKDRGGTIINLLPRRELPIRQRIHSIYRFAIDSRNDLLDHVPVHVGQAAVDAVVAEGQPLVVDAEQVQHRGVQVVAVGRVARRPCTTTRRSRRR